MYRISLHAARRIKQRQLRVEWLLAALEGLQVKRKDGAHLFGDPLSRCVLVVDVEQGMIITALKLKPARFRRIFKRGPEHYGS